MESEEETCESNLFTVCYVQVFNHTLSFSVNITGPPHRVTNNPTVEILKLNQMPLFFDLYNK